MAVPMSLRLIKILAVVLSTVGLMLPVWTVPSRAQSSPRLQNKIYFHTAPDRGAPPRTVGAGSRRSSCISSNEGEILLAALMPSNNVGTTIAPNPTIYVYIPELRNKQAEFILVETQEEKVVYQTTFPLSKSSGIVKLNLPPTVELKPGNNYQWYFGVICNPNNREEDERITGWIERNSISPELQMKIEQAQQQPLEQAKLYAKAGIWNEALTILEQLRSKEPTAWAELLNSVGLGEFAQNPILDCCQVNGSPQLEIGGL